MGIVDLHDVSRMHRDAIRRPEIKNERFIASAGGLFKKEVADILEAEFGSKGYKVTTKEAAGDRVRLARFNIDKTEAVFGKLISPKDSLITFAQTLIDFGVIKKHE